MPFREACVVQAAGDGSPKRITDMAHVSAVEGASRVEAVSPNEDSLAALARKVRERAERGISEVVWTPGGEGLVFAFRGDPFRVNADGSGLKRLTDSGKGKKALAFSPDGRFLSYLQEEDLWL